MAGILLITLPLIASPVVKMAVITLSIAWFTSCFTTNIWSIITSSVRKEAVGAASGIINGIGAGVGGTTAGFVVEFLHGSTGSYLPGFVVIGIVAIVGGLSVYTYCRIKGAG
ncbi:sugar transporter [Candidatus Sodalis pierantonius]|uniref:sugar transporter n=1 Tax=Candidatus Sodalis pierantonii TaxID=1486991 RepID=UPI001F23A019|nr:sugar transporter [Candidatus Sodalis pierantonius]